MSAYLWEAKAMSFFNINSKYSHWLFIVMGFSLAIITSTSAIAIAAEGVSENKQAMPKSIMIDKVLLGVSRNKAFYIITTKEQEIKNYILETLKDQHLYKRCFLCFKRIGWYI